MSSLSLSKLWSLQLLSSFYHLKTPTLKQISKSVFYETCWWQLHCSACNMPNIMQRLWVVGVCVCVCVCVCERVRVCQWEYHGSGPLPTTEWWARLSRGISWRLKHQMVLLNGQRIAVVILVLKKQSAVRGVVVEGALSCSPWCFKDFKSLLSIKSHVKW